MKKKQYLAVLGDAVVDKEGKYFVIKKGISPDEPVFIPVEIMARDMGLTGVKAEDLKPGDDIMIKGAYEILHKNIGHEIKILD